MSSQEKPHSVEAEQALLGCILLENDAARLASRLTAADFYDPLHGEIFRIAVERITAGETASPSLLASFIRDFPGIGDVGGVGYLARLANAAVSPREVPEHAKAIKEAAQRRAIIEAAERAVKDARRPDAKPEHLLAAWEGEIAAMADAADDGPADTSLTQVFAEGFDDVWEAYRERRPLMGVSSGVADLDEITGGWKPGRLIILGGRPSMGKSALGISFAQEAARAGHGVLFCSLEMEPQEIAARMSSAELSRARAPLPYFDIMRAKFNDSQAEKLARVNMEAGKLPIRITGPNVRNVGALAHSARRAARILPNKGATLDLIVVDYLGLVEPPRDLRNRVTEIGEVTAALKRLARDLGVPVIALAQLSRGVEGREDKRPMMSDLRDSGEIEQHADAVMFAYRHEYYVGRSEPNDAAKLAQWEAELNACRNTCDVIVAKNRMGAIGTARLHCEIQHNVFRGAA